MNRAVRLRAESGYENRPDIYCVGSLYLVGGIKKWLDTADLEEIG
jgi:hypothetical protein